MTDFPEKSTYNYGRSLYPHKGNVHSGQYKIIPNRKTAFSAGIRGTKRMDFVLITLILDLCQ